MMTKNFKTITAVLLSLVIAFAFTLTGCGEEKNLSADVSENVAGISYYHYDPSDFKSMCDELEELATGNDADAVIILTEWNQFRGLDIQRLKKAMRGNLFADFRNIYDHSLVEKAGFTYIAVGR